MRKPWIILLISAFVLTGWISVQAADNGPLADKLLPEDSQNPTAQAINDGLKAGVAEFGKKLGHYFHLPEESVDLLLKEAGLTPADAYMAAKVSRASGRNVRDVADAYKKNQGKGWGVIAKEMGIKPGSEAFHALKEDDSGLLKELGIERPEKAKTKGKRKSKKNKGNKGSKGKKN